MDSTANRSFAALNDDELDRLVEIIVEQFGSSLDRAQFADVALTVFEDIARLETITTKQANRYVAALWRRYRAKSSWSPAAEGRDGERFALGVGFSTDRGRLSASTKGPS